MSYAEYHRFTCRVYCTLDCVVLYWQFLHSDSPPYLFLLCMWAKRCFWVVPPILTTKPTNPVTDPAWLAAPTVDSAPLARLGAWNRRLKQHSVTVTHSLFHFPQNCQFLLLNWQSLSFKLLNKWSSRSDPVIQAGSEFSRCSIGCLSSVSVEFGVKRLHRGHNQSCFRVVLSLFQLLARLLFHTHLLACSVLSLDCVKSWTKRPKCQQMVFCVHVGILNLRA